jgi:hypothetical protein
MSKLKVAQLVIAQWKAEGVDHLNYSTLAVGRDGNVYRYDSKCEGWIPWPMDIVDCRTDHPNKR